MEVRALVEQSRGQHELYKLVCDVPQTLDPKR